MERWPTPDRIAAGIEGVYVGRVEWAGHAKRLRRRIVFTVRVDRDAFVAREVISYSRPGARDICSSQMLVPLEITLRIGRDETTLRRAAWTYDGRVSVSAPLPEAFASSFASAHADGFEVHVSIAEDAGGRFELGKRDVPFERPNVFVARRRKPLPGESPGR